MGRSGLRPYMTVIAERALPGFLFAEGGDVGGVVFAVPFVHEEEPVDIFLAGFRMDYGAGKVFFFHTVPGEVPAFVEGVEERLRDGDGGFGVGEFGPLG